MWLGDNGNITPDIAGLHIKHRDTRISEPRTQLSTIYIRQIINSAFTYNILLLRCIKKEYHFFFVFLISNNNAKVWDLFEGVQPPLATITIQQQKCHKITKYHLAADFVGGSKMYQLARLAAGGVLGCWWQLQILNFWVNLQNSNCIAIV